jgi:hypothetical protein
VKYEVVSCNASHSEEMEANKQTKKGEWRKLDDEEL